jgi:hypothetical protein
MRFDSSTSQISTSPESFPMARYEPSSDHETEQTGVWASLLGSALETMEPHGIRTDSRIRAETTDFAGIGVPDVYQICQTDGNSIRAAPVHEVEIVVVHKARGVQDPLGDVWGSSLLRPLGSCAGRRSATGGRRVRVEEVVPLRIEVGGSVVRYWRGSTEGEDPSA